MISVVDQHRDALADVCRRFSVRRLELFGSANTSDFDQQNSDLDFLVEFLPGTDLGPWLGRYFELQHSLEALFGRHVDLVMSSAVRNPYFAREANRTRRLLYAAEEPEAA
jgi:predicted nucleotidyltransferase